MCDHDLTQLAEGPTRFASATASQLDLMFVDNTIVVNDCLTLPPIADHSPTLLDFHLNFSRPLTASHQTWNWKCADFAGLNRFLESADWSTVFSAPNPTAAVSEWEKMLLSSMKRFIPARSCFAPRSQDKPWFNSYLFRLRRIRNRLFSRSKLLHHEHRLSVAYRKLRNLYVAELRQAERRYYQLQISALSTGPLLNNAHRWWKSAKAAWGIQTCDTVPSLLHQGCMKTSAEDKADCSNSVFAVQCSAPPSTGKPRVSSTSVDIPESLMIAWVICAETSRLPKSKTNLDKDWETVFLINLPERQMPSF